MFWRKYGSWLLLVAESVTLFGIGLFLYFRPTSQFLGEVFMVITFIVLFNRLITQIENVASANHVQESTAHALAPIHTHITKISQDLNILSSIIDLSSHTSIPQLKLLIERYFTIHEKQLFVERDRIVSNAISQLDELSRTLRTPVLEEPDFYGWLYREFDRCSPGSRIEIVSMDEDLEWTDTPQEAQFFEKNVNASKRGVHIERIFCFHTNRRQAPKENKYIYAHRTGNSYGLIGRAVDVESFQRSAPAAHAAAKQGFIIIDRKFAIVDVFSADGKARGYVTFNAMEVAEFVRTFELFHNLSERLAFSDTSPQ